MYLDSYDCVQCVEHVEETRWHLFFECPFSQACWIFLGINWDTDLEPLEMFTQAWQDFGSSIFREVVVLSCWAFGVIGIA